MYIFRRNGGANSRTDAVFTTEDIQHLVHLFPPTTSLYGHCIGEADDTHGASRLIKSVSGDGFVKVEALRRGIGITLAEARNGVAIRELATRLDVSYEAVAVIIDEDPTKLLSSGKEKVFGDAVTRAVAKSLHEATVEQFVNVDHFITEHGLHSDSGLRLVALCNSIPRLNSTESVKMIDAAQDLSMPGVDVEHERYFYTDQSWMKLRDLFHDIVRNAIQAEKNSAITGSNFELFPAATVYVLARKWLQELRLSEDSRVIYDGVSCPRIIPVKHIFRRRDIALRDLESGATPYFHISEWETSLIIPTVFQSRESAIRSLSERKRMNESGQAPVSCILDGYIISDAYLESDAARVDNAWNSGVVDTQETVGRFPPSLRDALTKLYKEKIVRRLINNGNSPDSIVSVDAYMLNKSWLDAVESDTKTIACRTADQAWNDNSSPRRTVGLPDIQPHFKDWRLRETSLCEVVWNKPGSVVQLAKTAKQAFEARLGELDAEDASDFAATWKTKLAAKITLYERGVSKVQNGALKDQLTVLLSEHISLELVAQIYKRTMDQRLCRSECVIKLLQRLAEKLRTSKDLSTTKQELDRFYQKLALDPLTDEDLAEAKIAELRSWYRTFETDKNGARRLICAVLILYSKQYEDLLYATAKFAPKLLRLLKDSMDVGKYLPVERMKDEVKAGKILPTTEAKVEEILKDTLGNLDT